MGTYSVRDAVMFINCAVRDNVELATRAFMLWKGRYQSPHLPEGERYKIAECIEAARKDLYAAKKPVSALNCSNCPTVDRLFKDCDVCLYSNNKEGLIEEDKDRKGNDVHIEFAFPDLAAGILQRASEEGRVVTIPSLGIELHPIQPALTKEEKRADPVKSTVSLLAVAVLEEALAGGKTVEIPSLGIVINPTQPKEKDEK